MCDDCDFDSIQSSRYINFKVFIKFNLTDLIGF